MERPKSSAQQPSLNLAEEGRHDQKFTRNRRSLYTNSHPSRPELGQPVECGQGLLTTIRSNVNGKLTSLAHSFFAQQPRSATGASPPIDIEIETSGYAKFRRMPLRRSGEVINREAILAAAAEDTPSRNDIGVFSRQIVMGYSKSLTANIKEKFQRMEQAGRSRLRSDSAASVDSAISDTPLGELHGMKARGYTFTSPWDGKCEFRTGSAGRSVQCRHTLYDGAAAVYNPLMADQGIAAPRSGATTVSELRFNLPSSEVLGEQARSAKDQWRGNFNKLLKPSHGTDSHDDDGDDAVSPFEVNVGSERAGGGNRGSRAKLGKLIIYNDGLKMLDLLVAANVGVWWGAWEKSF